MFNLPDLPVPSHLLPMLNRWKRSDAWGISFGTRLVRGTSSNYSVIVERDPLLFWLRLAAKTKVGCAATILCWWVPTAIPLSPSSLNRRPRRCCTASRLASSPMSVPCCIRTASGPRFYRSVSRPRWHFVRGLKMLKGLSGVGTHEHREWLPIFANTQDIPALADKVAAMHAEQGIAHGYLIAGHGIYTWAKTSMKPFANRNLGISARMPRRKISMARLHFASLHERIKIGDSTAPTSTDKRKHGDQDFGCGRRYWRCGQNRSRGDRFARFALRTLETSGIGPLGRQASRSGSK